MTSSNARWKKPPGLRYVSIKIPALDTDASGEAAKAKHILTANSAHEGFGFVRTPIDEFNLQGPKGTHLCLVYHPMRETLLRFQRRLPRQRLAMPIFKPYMYLLLQALDYLHSECQLIHTDIKEDNIMIRIENDAVLNNFVEFYKANPQPRHIRPEDGRVTYLADDDLGPLQSGGDSLLPELSDFNLSMPILPNGGCHLSPIQSHRYRAPEVLLGCPWTYSVDIWNLGLLMWNLLEDVSLFDRPAGDHGEYDAHVHLARLASLFGDPPDELVKRENMYRKLPLGRLVYNARGEACETMNQYWGGPFFDDDGQILRQDLVRHDTSLADTVTEVAGHEKEGFLDFAACMLQWLPEKRKTAKELLQHPFFAELEDDRREYDLRRQRPVPSR
ncbi:protein kinase domain protein [Niveomyces insectorum RCEF 264]|uniref:Protein kinase domain protein n=1 Tax=Niveomyces insectorum RCEF 264 TaxID=1081102 RepID=A0A167ZT06_9HYPO|nr:protein kinase domain protein [Niveomyces insectorum RCEF 264]